MSKAAAKPIQSDPLTGRRVAITGGKHAGQHGKVSVAYRGRPAGLDRAYVEIEGEHPGWSVAIELQHLKVMA